ncbi:hypothetical protein A3Q56_06878 [Intoshia linei]|uniref:Uncharacterized protein n=1 Tax=Intoshia linei TaxID=1819745 RepID=A0A177AUH0_9BILA|nr:hypothetical protein A3Q56_06878 [Intoshia linei]
MDNIDNPTETSIDIDIEDYDKQDEIDAVNDDVEMHKEIDYALEHDLSSLSEESDSDQENKQLNFNQIEMTKPGAYTTKEVDALKLLCESRSRQLNETLEHLEKLKSESEQNDRLSNHQINLLNDEKNELLQKVKQFKQSSDNYKTKYETVQHNNEQLMLKQCHLESTEALLKKKICDKEKALVNLNEYVNSLQSTDTLEKIRTQHLIEIDALRGQCEMDVNNWKNKKQELDHINKELLEKNDDQYNKIRLLNKRLEQSNLERIETVDRLSLVIKQTQDKYQTMIENSIPDNVEMLKYDLKNTKESYNIVVKKNQALIEQVDELNRQLKIHEQFATTDINTLDFDDSFNSENTNLPFAFSTPFSDKMNNDYSNLCEQLRKKHLYSNKLINQLNKTKTTLNEKVSALDDLKIIVYTQKVILDEIKTKIGSFESRQEFEECFQSFVNKDSTNSQKYTIEIFNVLSNIKSLFGEIKIWLLKFKQDFTTTNMFNTKAIRVIGYKLNMVLLENSANGRVIQKHKTNSLELLQVKKDYLDLCDINKNLELQLDTKSTESDENQISVFYQQSNIINNLKQENEHLQNKTIRMKAEIRKKLEMMKTTCIEMVEKLKNKHNMATKSYNKKIYEMKNYYCFTGHCYSKVRNKKKITNDVFNTSPSHFDGFRKSTPNQYKKYSIDSNFKFETTKESGISSKQFSTPISDGENKSFDYINRIGKMKENFLSFMDKFNKIKIPD